MIILLERPQITPNVQIQIEDCIDKYEFQRIPLLEEWLETNGYTLASAITSFPIFDYINHLSGFLKFHYRTNYSKTIVLENSFAWLGWLVKLLEIDKLAFDSKVKKLTSDPSFSNIKTIFMVPQHDDPLDIEVFQKSLKAQHDFILENYLAISDSRRKNKSYHLMAHEHNDALIPDLNKVLDKYPS